MFLKGRAPVGSQRLAGFFEKFPFFAPKHRYSSRNGVYDDQKLFRNDFDGFHLIFCSHDHPNHRNF